METSHTVISVGPGRSVFLPPAPQLSRYRAPEAFPVLVR
jgi:hypothetical protein